MSQEQSTSEGFSKVERYFRENKKSIAIIGGVAIALVLGFLAYIKFYKGPKEQEAQDIMWKAQYYFEKDSFNLAINGDGQHPGFAQIVDEYSGTDAGGLAYYYLGMCYLNTGQFDLAIEALENAEVEDMVVSSLAIGALGDAYMEKGDVETALTQYEEAASNDDNQFTTPLFLKKAAAIYESQGEWAKAKEHYQTIYDKYEASTEGRDIEKYLTRAKALSGEATE
jgi:tetratricopeptide (TPR) repeat protein